MPENVRVPAYIDVIRRDLVRLPALPRTGPDQLLTVALNVIVTASIVTSISVISSLGAHRPS